LGRLMGPHGGLILRGGWSALPLYGNGKWK